MVGSVFNWDFKGDLLNLPVYVWSRFGNYCFFLVWSFAYVLFPKFVICVPWKFFLLMTPFWLCNSSWGPTMILILFVLLCEDFPFSIYGNKFLFTIWGIWFLSSFLELSLRSLNLFSCNCFLFCSMFLKIG